jgi:hypothetical protein
LSRVKWIALLIMRDVLAVIPVVIHEEDSLATGAVLVAVPAPVLCVAYGHVQIDRRSVANHPPLDDNRPLVDQSRSQSVTDVETTIEAGLVDAERETDIGGEDRGRGDGQCYRNQ